VLLPDFRAIRKQTVVSEFAVSCESSPLARSFPSSLASHSFRKL